MCSLGKMFSLSHHILGIQFVDTSINFENTAHLLKSWPKVRNDQNDINTMEDNQSRCLGESGSYYVFISDKLKRAKKRQQEHVEESASLDQTQAYNSQHEQSLSWSSSIQSMTQSSPHFNSDCLNKIIEDVLSFIIADNVDLGNDSVFGEYNLNVMTFIVAIENKLKHSLTLKQIATGMKFQVKNSK